jgi:hypothetical protein
MSFVRGHAMRLVRKFGEMWARNLENINQIPHPKQGATGVYILYDGSMPVYVGKGHLRHRINGARRSKTRGQFWDHFSWYIIRNEDVIHDTEALFLRMLPPYLRSLTKQSGHFMNAVEKYETNQVAELISRRVRKKKTKR